MIQIDQYEAPPKHYIAGRKEGERLPTAHLSNIDGPNCPQAARLKEAGVMGAIVLIILAVTLLVILPALFLLLMLGGLADGVRRAFFSSGHNKQTPPPV